MATIIKREETVHHFDGCGGDSFKPTVAYIISYLEAENCERANKDLPLLTATLKFNEHTINIEQNSDPDLVWVVFKDLMRQSSAAYRASPLGIEQAAETARRVVHNQERIDAVMQQLTVHLNEDFPAQKADGLTQPDGDLARKVWELILIATDAGDTHGIKWDKDEFVRLLNGFGYERRQYAGDNRLDTYNMETHRAYIAGQILDCMSPESFGLIPPVAGVKIEQHGLHTNIYIP